MNLLLVCALFSSMYFDPSEGNCNCNGIGMIGNCSNSGECICKTGHIGGSCEKCGFGYFKSWGRPCQQCPCKDDGMTGDCNYLGFCYCKDGYTNRRNKCISCNCFGPGGTGHCSLEGNCICRHGYYRFGPHCKKCPPCKGEGMTGGCSFFGCDCLPKWYQSGNRCIKSAPEHCYCPDLKATTGECNIFGHCICNKGYYAKAINECAECKCFGNGMTGECTGRKECKCKKGWSGENCDQLSLEGFDW